MSIKTATGDFRKTTTASARNEDGNLNGIGLRPVGYRYPVGLTATLVTVNVADVLSGGDQTIVADNVIHQFNSSSTLEFSGDFDTTCEVLVIGGGGGFSGGQDPGGGGAGGYRYQTGVPITAAGVATITVGGKNGDSFANLNSGFGPNVATRGGANGKGQGGSGGGGDGDGSSPNHYAGQGTPGQGSPGGQGGPGGRGGGGGGSSGSGAPGQFTGTGGGGASTTNSITGVALQYAGGGGGARRGLPVVGSASAGIQNRGSGGPANHDGVVIFKLAKSANIVGGIVN